MDEIRGGTTTAPSKELLKMSEQPRQNHDCPHTGRPCYNYECKDEKHGCSSQFGRGQVSWCYYHPNTPHHALII